MTNLKQKVIADQCIIRIDYQFLQNLLLIYQDKQLRMQQIQIVINMKHLKKNAIFLILFLSLLSSFTSSQTSDQYTSNKMHKASMQQPNSHSSQEFQNNQNSPFKYFLNKSIQETWLILKSLYQTCHTNFQYAISIVNTTKHKSKPVNYKDNFASSAGGAQILMISSDQIMSPKSILDSNPDTYLYTDESLPLTIVIGLNQQVMLDTFLLKSSQVYSRITKNFILEGSFSISDNTQWIFLGNFTAENTFQRQIFSLQHTIIKYLKITIISSYGTWKYFSLTQIQVFGQGLFTHALETLVEANIKERQQLKNQMMKNSIEENITSQLLSQQLQNLVQQSMEEFETQAHSLVYNLINHKIPFQLPDQALQEVKDKTQKMREIKKNQHMETIQFIQFQEEVQDIESKLNALEKTNQKLQIQIKQLKDYYISSTQSSRSINTYESLQFYLIALSFFTSFICVIVLIMVQQTRKKQAKVIEQKKIEMFKQLALQKVALIVKSSSLFKQFAQPQN